ncbi:DUF1775 domain-containing protein [Nocardia mangyaensis]|uniref:DUF1775 domain-containing protein n=1 Tax=Nocardia mangyaensis TaxID=2213200 RepID=UPI0009044545|nr:DUF1775 domain-containing protein [Nocardia mangyaensis]
MPKQDTVAFKAVQTYSDGKVETWDQPTPAGADEPEFPLPVLTLVSVRLRDSVPWRAPAGQPGNQAIRAQA